MDTCACGGIVNEGSTRCDRCAALQALGLEHGASSDDVKDAYRTLAKVWHPDRFPNDERLRRAAEEKLKDINSAYQLLTTSSDRQFRYRPSQRRSSSRSSEPPPPKQPRSESQSTSRPSQQQSSQPNPPRAEQQPHNARPTMASGVGSDPWRFIRTRFFRTIVTVLVVVLVVKHPWVRHETTTVRSTPSTTSSGNAPFGDAVEGAMPGTSAPPVPAPPVATGVNPFNSFEPESTPSNTLPKPLSSSKKVVSKAGAIATVSGGYARQSPPRPEQAVGVEPTTSTIRSRYFTVGSTKNDVLRIQGTPTEFSEDVFHYGLSTVSFNNGVVESWDILPGDPLKARLLPSTKMPRKAYFTVGSTKDEVLAVQGTPTEFSEDVFHYGLSTISFNNGVVESWDILPGDPLKVRLRGR